MLVGSIVFYYREYPILRGFFSVIIHATSIFLLFILIMFRIFYAIFVIYYISVTFLHIFIGFITVIGFFCYITINLFTIILYVYEAELTKMMMDFVVVAEIEIVVVVVVKSPLFVYLFVRNIRIRCFWLDFVFSLH